ncbi:hypothetical protein IQ268_30575 [Oculatella sp. LEGE 06141]|uniref:hypothetical protein n=1 Tax=Oculatella sp. LEGE 06141 TaxID=1828648 RepID=UPI00187DEB1F|nr:hypothetical protein [Oculatella sp. LEGE 06141]MBE9182884.1 hypothetical protein [Oculatella sp. LEGE 06141]
MTKAHLIALFGLGCAANTLISWLAAIHPSGHAIGKAIYFSLVIALLFGLVFDDAIYSALKMEQTSYYGLLGTIVLTVVLGGGLVWLS